MSLTGSRRQSGMTLIGFVIVLIVAGLFAYVAIKLAPVYQEHWAVVKAMEAVKAEPGAGSFTIDQIKQSLDKKFFISYVYSVKPNHIIVTRVSGAPSLRIKYEVRDKLVGNLDFIASFDDTVKLGN